MPDDEQSEIISYPIKYGAFSASDRNAYFGGSGELTVDLERGTFTFTGTRRALFEVMTTSVTLTREQIFDVEVRLGKVIFNTESGDRKLDRHPFIFHCADFETALRIARMMPQQRSRAALENETQFMRLQRICPVVPPRRSPTIALIALNAAIYVFMGVAGAGWIAPVDLNPYIEYGANFAPITTDGHWHRLLTSAFLHYGIFHIGFNMFALSNAGRLMERLVGPTLYLLTYVASAAFGSLASIYWNQENPVWSAGASGAVFGVFGSTLGFALGSRNTLPKTMFLGLRNGVITIIGYNMLFGALHPGIDNAAHLGGLVAGIILGFVTAVPISGADRPKRLMRRIPLTLLVAVALCGIGVYLAPRYEAKASEIIPLAIAANDFSAEEHALLAKRFDILNRNLDTGDNNAETATMLRDEVLPFYLHWKQRFSEISIETGSAYSHLRDMHAQYIELRLRAYETLLRLVATDGDEETLRATFDQQNEMANELADQIETL